MIAMRLSVQGIDQDITQLNRVLSQKVQQVSDLTLATAQSVTPVATGRAKRAWTSTVNKTEFVVENRVPYIERLEAGASRQAPKGIIGPTLTRVKGQTR